jgi:hypothetical protein
MLGLSRQQPNASAAGSQQHLQKQRRQRLLRRQQLQSGHASGRRGGQQLQRWRQLLLQLPRKRLTMLLRQQQCLWS